MMNGKEEVERTKTRSKLKAVNRTLGCATNQLAIRGGNLGEEKEKKKNNDRTLTCGSEGDENRPETIEPRGRGGK